MEKKISVIIPNYNGRQLLSKNLPNVIRICKNCEIIVVDDASNDNSVDFISKNFKKIKIIRLDKNRGFAWAVNTAVKAAAGDLIVLLNSDLAPKESFLKASLHYFKDPTIFAVGFADLSHEEGKVVIRGRGGASFKKGLLVHYKLPSVLGETLWVSGGSGIFDKKKFLDLSGFDKVFAPFYWEDIDLSFRAWQAGYRCVFESKSKVDHFHEEGAIKKSKSSFFIKTVSYKNQFLFVWKNISDPLWLIQHLLWLPYHFAKALLTLDVVFFVGFLWAISYLPRLIFNYSLFTLFDSSKIRSSIDYSLSDREVLSKFAKS